MYSPGENYQQTLHINIYTIIVKSQKLKNELYKTYDYSDNPSLHYSHNLTFQRPVVLFWWV